MTERGEIVNSLLNTEILVIFSLQRSYYPTVATPAFRPQIPNGSNVRGRVIHLLPSRHLPLESADAFGSTH